ncbi:enoyl-CoA hydratase [Burkholderiaceae bacterium 16]|nr:enoyl-CoA hydratase [Burkholderiaceae bacterium 16]
MSPCLLYHVSEGVATLTLNRPETLNALAAELIVELCDAVERAAQDSSIRVVVLTGAGRGFCAGGNLGSSPGGGMSAGIEGSVARLRNQIHPLILTLRAMPKPVIAAVNGAAAGAGMSLAMAADVILAGKSATFLQAFTKIGLVPDSGSTYFLPRYVGEMRARALALLAEKIDADEAQRIGLVLKVYPDDELAVQAAKLARRLAGMPTCALALTKQALDGSLGNDLVTQLECEATLQLIAGRTEDFREGVAAFMEKRTPQFMGR